MTVFDVASGNKIFEDKIKTEMQDMTFSHDGQNLVWGCGKNKVVFFDPSTGKMKNGLFGDLDRKSSACITADDQGRAYSGATNGKIQVWEGQSGKANIELHGKSPITSITWVKGILVSGSKSGNIHLFDTGAQELISSVDCGNVPRALDYMEGLLTVGTRDGAILEFNTNDLGEPKCYMQGHDTAEAWGLDLSNDKFVTSGDDNKVMLWDPATRTCVNTAVVNTEARKAKKNKASTQGEQPESKASRGVGINNVNGHIAVVANDGSVTIRDSNDFPVIMHEIRDAKEWCEAVEYSPDGTMLAVGSHDTNIYIYDVEGYTLRGKCSKHNATITNIDWSADCKYIRSVCNGYELLFFTTDDCEQDTSGASNTKDMLWASQHCKFGWFVDGIFPKDVSGDHVNAVDTNED